MRFTFKALLLSGLILLLSPPSQSSIPVEGQPGDFWPIPYKNQGKSTLILLARAPEMAPEKEYIFGEDPHPLSLKEALGLEEAAAVLPYDPADLASASLSFSLQENLKLAFQKEPLCRIVVVHYGGKCNSDLLGEKENKALDEEALRLRRFSNEIRQTMPHLRVDLHLAQPTGRVIPIPHSHSWVDLTDPS